MSTYNHQEIEEKWLKIWEEAGLFQGTEKGKNGLNDGRQATNDELANKLFLLFAFAYPSGSGLHVGHVESKTALDILARFNRMQGKEVFFPVGWDAFGLPAENYAIKTGVPPVETTKQAIDTFRSQIKRLAISYDWANELATCHPGYYKWTQWLFLKLFEAGLAYKKPGMVNWCPSCQTVLANEQVINGLCERCDSEVIQKEMNQWYFKITHYADELISGLDQVDWPEATKKQQLEWIGKAKGVSIGFTLRQTDKVLPVWTKFWETVFGVTFLVISPEKFSQWQMLDDVPQDKKPAVTDYLKQAAKKTEEERKVGEKDKSGVDTGLTFINPVNGAEVPLFIADYVLANVGTGVVMGVSAHDSRDFAFAKKFGLPCIQVVAYENQEINEKVARGEMSHEGEGTLIHSGEFNGLSAWGEGKEKIFAWMTEQGFAGWETTYRLRDWLISRQRYWGAPIPIVYDPQGKPHSVKSEHLPWMLPTDVEFKPTGESPLTHSKEFKARVETLYGNGWSPEFDTMDTFVDSSWYFLRYASVAGQKKKLKSTPSSAKRRTDALRTQVHSSKEPLTRRDDSLDSNSLSSESSVEKNILRWDRDWTRDASLPFDQESLKAWLPVDMYMIGPEHIVLHLLYSRFFTKFLRDQGLLSFDEPFAKMRHQGIIMGPDGKRMSKSRGNVINPDEIVAQFGADTLRMYEMFMGPIEADKPWDPRAVAGVSRFLKRLWNLLVAPSTNDANADFDSVLHKTLKQVSEQIPQLKYNTSIAALMELANAWADLGAVSVEQKEIVIKMIAPFAPFMAEELWQGSRATSDQWTSKTSVHTQIWPSYDPMLLVSDSTTLVVQINGKRRGELVLSDERGTTLDEAMALELIQSDAQLAKWLEGKQVRKTIFIKPGEKRQGLVNVVVS